jgi:molybdate transport system substrate-binding protein
VNDHTGRPLRLLSGLATQPALANSILPSFTGNTGIHVETVFEPTTILLNLINNGEHFDVLLGVTSAIQRLSESGHILAETVRVVARSGIGVATTGRSTAGGFHSMDEFIDTLRVARSVAYSRFGASGIYFAEALDRLGIREEIDARATVIDKGLTAAALFDGRADVAIQQVSELLSVPGAIILGTLPPEIQSYTEFSVGVGVASLSPDEARSLAGALATDQAGAAYLATGLTLPE